MSMLHNASLFARLTLILGVVPLVMAVVYASRPTERATRRKPSGSAC